MYALSFKNIVNIWIKYLKKFKINFYLIDEILFEVSIFDMFFSFYSLIVSIKYI